MKYIHFIDTRLLVVLYSPERHCWHWHFVYNSDGRVSKDNNSFLFFFLWKFGINIFSLKSDVWVLWALGRKETSLWGHWLTKHSFSSFFSLEFSLGESYFRMQGVCLCFGREYLHVSHELMILYGRFASPNPFQGCRRYRCVSHSLHAGTTGSLTHHFNVTSTNLWTETVISIMVSYPRMESKTLANFENNVGIFHFSMEAARSTSFF